MTTKDFCKRQVRRLAGLDYFPNDAMATGELISALETAPSDDAVERFVSGWLREETRAPKKSEIIRLIYEQNAAARAARLKCDLCGGDTFISADYLVTLEAPFVGAIPVKHQILPLEWRLNPPQLAENQTIMGGARPCPRCRPNGVPNEEKYARQR